MHEQQQRRIVDDRLAPAVTDGQALPKDEAPCFRIDQLALSGELADDFRWALESAGHSGGVVDDWHGRCLGPVGVNVLLARVQQAISAKGYVTTRVLVGPKDPTTGTLALALVPSRIAAIRFKDLKDGGKQADVTSLRGAIPARVGDLLNMRDIEHALENLKRLPTVDADIQIEAPMAPDARPGDRELVVTYIRKRPLRWSLNLDDSGIKTEGKIQAGATVAWDGPLGLNDLFQASLNHDALDHKGQGRRGQTMHYSVPYGYWLLSATASRSDYFQSVTGLADNYTGNTNNTELRLSRSFHRGGSRKSTTSIRAFHRRSRSSVEDAGIAPQNRVAGGWETSLNHREFIDKATLDGTLAYRRGTDAFTSLEAPEASYGEGTSRMKLFTAEVSLKAPFKVGSERLRYGSLWRGQWNRTPLALEDQFAIGGRYTVRGFDGENSLLGERGWFIRNDLGWAAGQSGAELYAGVDYGHVGGAAAKDQVGDELAGGVVGVRGAYRGLSYDFFLGAPISKPEGFPTAKIAAGFNLNYAF